MKDKKLFFPPNKTNYPKYHGTHIPIYGYLKLLRESITGQKLTRVDLRICLFMAGIVTVSIEFTSVFVAYSCKLNNFL